MAKMKVLLVPVAALLACFSFSFSAVASPLVAARVDDALANAAVGCVASQGVFTSLDYEFAMEAIEHVWGEPQRLGVSVLTLPGSSEHQFNLSSSGTSASQGFNLSGGLLTFGDTFCSIRWGDPSAAFNMFPHCEKEKTSTLLGHTWAAYETCLPGTDYSEPTLVVTPVFGKDVSKVLTFITSQFLPQNQIYFTLNVANPPPSLHRQFTRFFLTAKKPTPVKRTPLDSTVADGTVADTTVPESAAACIESKEGNNTLQYPFTLNAVQLIQGKANVLGVSLYNSQGRVFVKLSSESTAPAAFKLENGTLRCGGGIAEIGFQIFTLEFPVLSCVADEEQDPGLTWEARDVCQPGQLKPTLFLLPLFNGAVQPGSHWSSNYNDQINMREFKPGYLVEYLVGAASKEQPDFVLEVVKT